MYGEQPSIIPYKQNYINAFEKSKDLLMKGVFDEDGKLKEKYYMIACTGLADLIKMECTLENIDNYLKVNYEFFSL